VTIPAYGADSLRRTVHFPALIKAGCLTGALVADLLAPATVTTAGVLGTGTQAYGLAAWPDL
jgi:hypothetical protein